MNVVRPAEYNLPFSGSAYGGVESENKEPEAARASLTNVRFPGDQDV